MVSFLPHITLKLKKHIALVLSGGIIGVLIFTFIFYNEPDLWFTYQQVILTSALVGVLIVYLLSLTSPVLNHLTHWQKQPGVNIITSILIHTTLVFALMSGYLYLYHDQYLELPVTEGVYTKLFIIAFVGMLIYSVVYLVINSFQYLQKNLLDHVQFESRQVDLQLTALKSQLTPHFLFNSLNTISSLIHQGPEVTEKYTRNLAKIYQYTLPAYDKKLVTFSEEWEFVQANLELLSQRFGDALIVKLDSPDLLMPIKMPPLTLQLLIENALKHNQIGKSDRLEVHVTRKGNWWFVSNNITTQPIQVVSFKVGLKNIQERYGLLGNHRVEVDSDARFSVKLPVL